jgi:diadenosine tetraphosphate (Ap4A) HIT family hydrolase
MPAFQLDPRLAADTFPLHALGLSDLLIMNDARFPWVILVPRVTGAAEIIDLGEAERGALWGEIATVSAALRAATACDKLNVAALGNQVRQLHVHVIARFTTDAAWPKPVWGAGAAEPYAAERREALSAAIRSGLTRPGG